MPQAGLAPKVTARQWQLRAACRGHGGEDFFARQGPSSRTRLAWLARPAPRRSGSSARCGHTWTRRWSAAPLSGGPPPDLGARAMPFPVELAWPSPPRSCRTARSPTKLSTSGAPCCTPPTDGCVPGPAPTWPTSFPTSPTRARAARRPRPRWRAGRAPRSARAAGLRVAAGRPLPTPGAGCARRR